MTVKHEVVSELISFLISTLADKDQRDLNCYWVFDEEIKAAAPMITEMY